MAELLRALLEEDAQPPETSGGGDTVAAPAPRWGEGGASAGTPLPGDRPMVAPEDTTADALPQKRYRND